MGLLSDSNCQRDNEINETKSPKNRFAGTISVYQKQVRSALELAVPVWQPALTAQEKSQIERVQKCALYIILGSNYVGYKHALNLIGCESLEDRRIKLCEKFARKASKHLKYQNWF